MVYQHEALAAGKWQELTLAEQMGNVGSEVSRALGWRDKNERLFMGAVERALELLDFTIADPRWRRGLKELTRVREFLCDIAFGERQYHISLEDLDHYFFQFALAARFHK